MKRWAIIGIVATLIIVTIIVMGVTRTGMPVQAVQAKRGDIREFVDERGKTRLPRVYQITMPQPGWIQEITLEEGTPVKKGQIVARMSTEDLENNVAEARAVVERLEAAIRENDDIAVEANLALQAKQFVESMTNTVEAAKARMEASLKRSEFAETNLGRIQRLFESSARTEDDKDRANLAYWEGQLGYRQDLLVWESLKAIKAATALLPKMVGDYIAHKRFARAVLEKQKAGAEAQLRRIMTLCDRGIMRSAVDGVVLKRLIENEQQLSAGTELLRIGQLDKLEVEADILSEDVVRIRQGNPVDVYGPAVGALAGQGIEAAVDQIHPSGFMKISSLGVEQQRVKVIMRLSPEGLQLLRQRAVGVDFRVRVRIYTRQKSNALIVPRAALFRGPDGGWQLFAVRNHRAMRQSVEVGLMNDHSAEIASGIEEGENVILAPDNKLGHGSRVRPVVR